MTKFRTIKLSDPVYEHNHLRFMTVKSPALRGRGDIALFIPPNTENKTLPLVLLLHGVYGSHWAWALNGGVHITALQMIEAGEINPMVIAMPSDGLWGDGSGYLPHHQANYEQWIVNDSIEAMKETLPQINENSVVFIGGLSMGGFGALRLGAKYHDRFKAISAHSAITDLSQFKLFVEEDLDWYAQADKKNESVWETLKYHRGHLPPFRFDCGMDDLLIDYNRALHRKLSVAGIPHIYEEYSGRHEWEYWRTHVKDSLLFFNHKL
jgi:putative tributyrin esterase